jgi:hypothetical protein
MNILFSGEPAIETRIFGMQAFYTNLQHGNRGVYVSSLPPRMVIDDFMEHGFEIDRSKVDFIDCYSALSGQESDAEFVVRNPNDIDEVYSTLAKAVKARNGERLSIAVDSVSTLIDYCGEMKVLKRLDDFMQLVKNSSSVGIYGLTEWAYPQDVIKGIHDDMDAVIVLRGIEERVIYGQYFSILKLNWREETERRSVLFKVIKPGGVRAFVPKVLVTGPFHAGKTTFVHALSTRAVSVERLGTTVALDHGHIDRNGIAADIFGTPGQDRFDPILTQLGGSSLGVILVVDSTDPQTFSRAKTMIQKTRTFGLPYVVAANKQDVKNALKPEEVRKKMELPQDIPILPCVATKNKGVAESFETLLDRIL